MEDLLPKQPFHKRIEFLGRLSKPGMSVGNLQMVVQYSLVEANDITGRILGSHLVSKDLLDLLDHPGLTFSLSSEPASSRVKVESDNLWLPGVSTRYLGDESMIYPVSDLSIRSLEVSEQYGPDDTDERNIIFFVTGPRAFWQVKSMRTMHPNGQVDSEILNSTLNLETGQPLGVEVKPWFFFEQATDEAQEATARVLAVHVRTTAKREDLPDPEFIQSARFVLDHLTLLVSFLSRRWVRWFRYEFWNGTETKSFYRVVHRCTTEEVEIDSSPVAPTEVRTLLENGFRRFRNLALMDSDLWMPIVYFVSGCEAEYLEDRFASLFLSLEKIKDIHARKQGGGRNVTKDQFDSLRTEIAGAIDCMVDSEEARTTLKGRIPELNRKPLRDVLLRLFSDYGVEWQDLYPSGSNLDLVGTRNVLFHSSTPINIETLAKETARLEALVQRLLLRMLDWRDLSRAPDAFKRRWLTGGD